jgi:hypothetical protein
VTRRTSCYDRAPTLNENTAVERHTGTTQALPTVTGGASSALALMTDFTNTVRQVEAFVNALVDTPFVPEAHWPLPVGIPAKEMPNRNPRMRHARETRTTGRSAGRSRARPALAPS